MTNYVLFETSTGDSIGSKITADYYVVNTYGAKNYFDFYKSNAPNPDTLVATVETEKFGVIDETYYIAPA